MKFIIVFVSLIVVALADRKAVIIRDIRNNGPDGAYNFDFATSNGIQREEVGEVKELPDNNFPSLFVRGSASWVSPEGENIELKYVANENGYQVFS